MMIPFYAFRIMVGCGLVMLSLAWLGSYLSLKPRLERSRMLLWGVFLSFPLPWIAILAGWYTAEVGRQPWTIYGVLRTADAVTPFLTASAAMTSLILFVAVYVFIFSFGTYYIYRLLRAGPAGVPHKVLGYPRPQPAVVACRPGGCYAQLSSRQRDNHVDILLGRTACHQHSGLSLARRIRPRRRHVVRLDQRRRESGAMLGTVAPVWDGNETWLVVAGVIMWGAFPLIYSMLMPAFYIPVVVMLLGLILRGVAFEFRGKASRTRWLWDFSFAAARSLRASCRARWSAPWSKDFNSRTTSISAAPTAG